VAWIELHQSLPTHRKTLAAADLLDLPPVYVVGHVTAFWLWALDNVPDGRLHNVSPRTIARAAQWPGEASVFVDAITKAGFLEPDGADLLIHDWWSYAGKLIDRREQNALRMREARAAHVHSTDTARAGATVPNPTEPNRTEPEIPLALAGARAKGKPKAPASEPKPKANAEQFEALCQVDGVDPTGGIPDTCRAILNKRAKECAAVRWSGKAILKIAELWAIQHPDIAATSAVVVKHGAGLLAHPPRAPAVTRNGRANGATRWESLEMPTRPNLVHADGTITDADGHYIGREGDGAH
jgi:hypothetical protein